MKAISRVLYDNEKQQYFLYTDDFCDIKTYVCVQTTSNWKQVLINAETNEILTKEYDSIKLDAWIVIVEKSWFLSVLDIDLQEIENTYYTNIKLFWNTLVCYKDTQDNADVFYKNFTRKKWNTKVLFTYWNIVVALNYWKHWKQESFLYVFHNKVYEPLRWIALFLEWKRIIIIEQDWNIADTNIFWVHNITQNFCFDFSKLSITWKHIMLLWKNNWPIIKTIELWDKNVLIAQTTWMQPDNFLVEYL